MLRNPTRKRIIALGFILASVFLAQHFWFLPDNYYGHYVFNIGTEYIGNRTVQFPNLPRINYTIYAFFTTDGGFFPANEVNYTAYIANPNGTTIQGLDKWYCCLGFTNATYTQSTDNHLALATKGHYAGYWVATGTAVFNAESKAYPYLFPTPDYTLNVPPNAITLQELKNVQNGLPAFTVGTQGDTLALNFDEFVAKLTFVGLSVSIVFFEPLVQELVAPHNKQDD